MANLYYLTIKMKSQAIVGSVVDSYFDPERNGIIASLRIIKTGNERLVELLKLNPSPITDVSIGRKA